MATQSQIEANRRNSQLSTGPRTPEGKARSSQNALKHGLRAQAIISSQIEVRDENPQEFADLLHALVDDLCPFGPLEEMCVESVAIAQWRLRRVIRSETGRIAERYKGMVIRELTPIGFAVRALPCFDHLDKLARYEAHLERQLYRALGQLAQLQRLRGLLAKCDALDAETEATVNRDIVENLPGACVPALPSESAERSQLTDNVPPFCQTNPPAPVARPPAPRTSVRPP